jgi:hypothetical protein
MIDSDFETNGSSICIPKHTNLTTVRIQIVQPVSQRSMSGQSTSMVLTMDCLRREEIQMTKLDSIESDLFMTPLANVRVFFLETCISKFRSTQSLS